MTDINPILDRQAHGASAGGLHLFHHHDRAADHHEKAAEQHRRAAEAHRAGDTAAAATYATQAWGHGAHAQEHANESLKGYATPGADIVVGATPAQTANVSTDEAIAGYPSSRTGGTTTASGIRAASTTSDEPPLGYDTGADTAATTVNPDAAYTPNIGGAPGQRS